MIIITGPRGSGRTTELIKQSFIHHIPIVCNQAQEVENILRLAKKIGVEIPRPVTANDVLDRDKRRGKEAPLGYLYDDIEQFIWRATNVSFAGGLFCRKPHIVQTATTFIIIHSTDPVTLPFNTLATQETLSGILDSVLTTIDDELHHLLEIVFPDQNTESALAYKERLG